MNFDLTDDQRAIQSTAREFLADRYKLDEVRRLALDDEQLSAVRSFVPEAGSADILVVVASGDRAFVVDAGADGVTIEPLDSLDPTRRLFKVTFDGAAAESLELDPDAFSRATRAAVT